MSNTVSVVEISSEHDVVTARQRARQVSGLLGFEEQDQTRVSTAVSEIARLFVSSKRPARIEFQLEGATTPQVLLVDIGWSRGVEGKSECRVGRWDTRTRVGIGGDLRETLDGSW